MTNSKTNKLNIYVGLGATFGVGSDCYPYTVVEIVSPTRIYVQEDDAIPDKDNGYNYYSNQVYIYVRNTKNKRVLLSLRKNGKWLPVGSKIQRGGCYAYGFSLGNRRKYLNPSF